MIRRKGRHKGIFLGWRGIGVTMWSNGQHWGELTPTGK